MRASSGGKGFEVGAGDLFKRQKSGESCVIFGQDMHYNRRAIRVEGARQFF